MTDKEFSRRFFLKTSAAGLVTVFTARGVGRSLSPPAVRPESGKGFEIHTGPKKGFFSVLFDGQSVIRNACVRVETESGIFNSFHERFVQREGSTESGFHLEYSDRRKVLDVELQGRTCENGDGLIIEVSVTNRSVHELRLKSISPVVASRERGGSLSPWTDAAEVRVLTDEWERCYGAAGVVPLTHEPVLRSAWDLHVFERGAGRCFSVSYLETPNAKLSFVVTPHEDTADFIIQADTRAGSRGVAVPAGRAFRLHELLLLSQEGTPSEVLGRYAGVVARRNGASASGSIPVGWVDWYFAKATTAEEEIVRIMDTIAQELKDYGLEYIQIDSGWQIGVETTPPPHNVIAGGPWKTNSRFPHGMKWLADRIKEKGFRPGIWVRPFHIIDGADERMTHPAWFNEKGQMDFTNPEVRKYVLRIFTMLVDDWGYEYIKYDFPSYDLFGEWGPKLYDDPGNLTKHRDQSVTTMGAYRESLQVVRDAVGGKARLLACNSVMPPTIGLADAFRIGDDVGSWERIFTMGVKSVAARFYMNGVYWWNDPDCLLVGDPLTLAQARSWASLIALTGGAAFISEDIRMLAPERLDIIKKVLPVFRNVPEEFACPVDFLENSPAELWNLQVKKDFGVWNVVGVFNWSEAEKEKNIDVSSLALHHEAPCCVHEFWEDTYVGELRDSLSVRLPAWACKVFAIREALPRPHIVSSGRHITQGGVELDDERWDEQHATLEGVCRVVKSTPYTISIRIPDGFRVAGVTGVERLDPIHKAIFRIRISSDATTTIPWSVRFDRD